MHERNNITWPKLIANKCQKDLTLFYLNNRWTRTNLQNDRLILFGVRQIRENMNASLFNQFF